MSDPAIFASLRRGWDGVLVLVVIHLVADLLEVHMHLDTAIFLEIVVVFELLRT